MDKFKYILEYLVEYILRIAECLDTIYHEH